MAKARKSKRGRCPAGKTYRKGYTRRDGTRVKGACVKKPRRRRSRRR